MSEDITKIMARMAAMEQELTTLRARPAQPAAPAFDEAAFRQAFTRDPKGMMDKYGVPVDHVTRVLVAQAMGDKAPDEIKVLAQMGPQVSAMMAMQSELSAMRQRLEAIDKANASTSTRDSFAKLAADKSKYPHLSAALATDPTLYDEDVAGFQGSASELADRIEKRTAKYAAALGAKPQSVSTANTDASADQSSQVKPALGGVDQTPPPSPPPTAGVWNEDKHNALKAEVMRKHNAAQSAS